MKSHCGTNSAMDTSLLRPSDPLKLQQDFISPAAKPSADPTPLAGEPAGADELPHQPAQVRATPAQRLAVSLLQLRGAPIEGDQAQANKLSFRKSSVGRPFLLQSSADRIRKRGSGTF